MFEVDLFTDPSEALEIEIKKIETIKILNIWNFYFFTGLVYNVSASLPWSQLIILHYNDAV